MSLPKELTTVTPLSKYLAMFLFIIFPFLGFFIGVTYQKALYQTAQLNTQQLPRITSSSQTHTNITSQQPTNSYTGWKQYCSKYEKSCFKYPPTWSIHSDVFNEPMDNAILSPSGGMFAFFSTANGADDGPCTKAYQVYIHKVIPNSHVTNLYIVEYGFQNSIDHIALINGTNGKAPTIGNTGQCVLESLFQSKNDPFNYPTGSSFGSTTPEGVPLRQRDIPTAELILASYTY